MTPFWKRSQAALALSLVAATTFASAPAAFAAVDLTPAQVIALAVRSEGKTPFKATREQQVIRQDMVLHADAKVDYLTPARYQIALTNPKEINGLNLVLDSNKMTAFFPKEKLLFQNDIPAGSEEIRDLILGKLTDDAASLARNYKVTVAPEMDIVALYPCYKLVFEPAKGLGPTSPPGRRVWVSKETGLVMKEERYWSNDMASYFISEYKNFSATQKPTVALTIPKDANKLKLVKGTATAMTRYATIASPSSTAPGS